MQTASESEPTSLKKLARTRSPANAVPVVLAAPAALQDRRSCRPSTCCSLRRTRRGFRDRPFRPCFSERRGRRGSPAGRSRCRYAGLGRGQPHAPSATRCRTPAGYSTPASGPSPVCTPGMAPEGGCRELGRRTSTGSRRITPQASARGFRIRRHPARLLAFLGRAAPSRREVRPEEVDPTFGLPRLLKPYRIRTMPVWSDGKTVKGYKVEQFADAFARVLGVREVRTVRSEAASEAAPNSPNPPNPYPTEDGPDLGTATLGELVERFGGETP